MHAFLVQTIQLFHVFLQQERSADEPVAQDIDDPAAYR